MKKLFFFVFITLLFSCSSDDDDGLKYDVTYTVTASNGASINKVEYICSEGDLVQVSNATSPWTINLHLSAGMAVEARAYGDIPYQGNLTIVAKWTAESGATQSEDESLPNNTPDSVIKDGKVEILG